MSKEYIADMIERYVYQATRRLPKKQREDVAAEIRTVIADMLEDRTGGLAPTAHDLAVVFTELGSPETLASKYAAEGARQYLIGPALYPMYEKLLKLVLLCAWGGMVIANLIAYFTGGHDTVLSFLWALISSLVGGGMGAFAFVTLLFAILERKAIKLPGAMGEKGALDLPPVPVKQARIKPEECVAGIVFTVLVMIFFALIPDALGAAVSQEGWRIIPLFDRAALSALLPFLLGSMALGLLREVLKLLEGRYSKRLAIGIVVLDVAAFVLCIPAFTPPGIWNQGFDQAVAAAYAFEGLDMVLLWGYFQRFFLGILAFAFVLDMGTALVRAYRSGK